MKKIILALTILLMTAVTALAQDTEQAKEQALQTATELYNNKQYKQAIAEFEKALQIAPTDEEALTGLGRCYEKLGYTTDAIETYTRIIKANPKNADAFIHRANSHLNKEDYRAATNDVVEALNLDRENTRNAKVILDQLEIDCPEYVLKQLKKRLKKDKKNADYWNPFIKQMEGKKSAKGIIFPDEDDPDYSERDVTEADNAQVPIFPGGVHAMRAWLNKKTKYDGKRPPVKVVIDCLIDENGKVVETKFVSGDQKLAKKAMKVCKSMPTFTPAKVNGLPTKCWLNITLRYKP